jgi:putative cardiolipin synthase
MTAMTFRRTALGAIAALGLLAGTGCTHSDLRPDYPRTPSTALPASHDSALTAYVARLVAQHPGQSGLRLVSDAGEALLARVALADRAKHTLDVQYYIFHSDATGKLLARQMLAAADRGVRVRVLLDDLHIAGNDDAIVALDGHPNIQIRLFNPFLERSPSTLGMGKQFVGDFSRLNRRMHNKALIVDGAIAIVGGRNIGDEYFDADRSVNFRDLDVLTVGPVVTQTEQMFDDYWNSEQVYPIAAFHDKPPSKTTIVSVREALGKASRSFRQSDYAHNLISRAGNLQQEEGESTWAWGEAQFLADTPSKGDPRSDGDSSTMRMAPQLKAWVDGAQHRLTIISPYFIPGKRGVAYLENLRKRDIDVAVLTNSLASTDAGGVYEAYAAYRPPMLVAGVTLYELKPAEAGVDPGGRLGASAGVSLHAKAMVVDDNHVFVGSMNLDPRSRDLNTEDGVIADSPALAKAVLKLFADATTPANAYRVRLVPGSSSRVYWESEEEGKIVRIDHAPETTWWRRFKTGFMAVLPIEGLL